MWFVWLLAAASAVAPPTQERIYGGNTTPVCAWPSTVMITLGQNELLCSGSLVGSDIVLYAAHCGTNVTSIAFGENTLQSPQISVAPSYCRTYPGHTPLNGTDFAYCKLTAPIKNLPIVPIAMGCEMNAVRAGKQVVLVGFGLDSNGNYGQKREVTTTQIAIAANKATMGGNGNDTCNGDSGGPAFVQLTAADALTGTADNSWRVYGITSYGVTSVCGNGSTDSLAQLAVPWIEADSGSDISPCHDADGAWDPGPDCRGFPLDPENIGNTWSNACVSASVSGPGATCGPAFNANAPIITFISPTGSTTAKPGSSVDVSLMVTDAATPNNVTVQITYDGVALAATQHVSNSYGFSAIAVNTGAHLLQATATDGAGNTTVKTLPLTMTALAPEDLGGCTSSAAPVWAVAAVSLLFLRRRRALMLCTALVVLCNVAACGKDKLTDEVSISAGNAYGGGNLPTPVGPSQYGTAPPAVVNTTTGAVNHVSFTAASSMNYYGSAGSYAALTVVLSNDANYCTYFANNADNKNASYFIFQMFDTNSTSSVPTDGNFTVVASGSVPTTAGQYAWASFVINDASCNNTLSSSQANATTGQVALRTDFSTGGAYVVGTFTQVLFGTQQDAVSGTFTGLGCSPAGDSTQSVACE